MPAWCFQDQVRDFVNGIGEEEKGKIQRLAFETLVRSGRNEEETVNNYIQIDGFRNLREGAGAETAELG